MYGVLRWKCLALACEIHRARLTISYLVGKSAAYHEVRKRIKLAVCSVHWDPRCGSIYRMYSHTWRQYRFETRGWFTYPKPLWNRVRSLWETFPGGFRKGYLRFYRVGPMWAVWSEIAGTNRNLYTLSVQTCMFHLIVCRQLFVSDATPKTAVLLWKWKIAATPARL